MTGNVIRLTGLLLILCTGLYAQADLEDIDHYHDTIAFDAGLSIGFNYDFLKPATKVSFDYPVGYIGLNIPFKYSMNERLGQDITQGLAEEFPSMEKFDPAASAQQYANTTIRVDVPMLGGVGTFANVQNFYFNYNNMLGTPGFRAGYNNDTLNLFLRGIMSVPFDVRMGWETMVFGYAYKVNELFKFALHLNRHTFMFDINARINSDILGYFDVNVPAPSDGANNPGGDIGFTTRENFGYNSNTVFGSAHGHYNLEAWTPTIGINVWRFGLTSRFGMKARASGSFAARSAVPFFIDPETMEVDKFDEEYLLDNMGRFLNSETDSVTYGTQSDLRWEMPQGHTLTFDIVREKLYISYTKFFGRIAMGLDDIGIMRKASDSESDSTHENIDFDARLSIDHILMIHGSFHNAFFHMGVFSMNAGYMEEEDLLRQAAPELTFGNGIFIPVLTFGTALGTKMQLLLEMDLLPLAALKTGLRYYF